jgi:hypothetical protein
LYIHQIRKAKDRYFASAAIFLIASLSRFLLIQRGDSLIEDRFECGFVGYSKIGQDFAINFDLSGSQPFDEPAVGRTILAARRVDALNPKTSKIAFPGFAVAVGPGLGLHRRVFGVSEKF